MQIVKKKIEDLNPADYNPRKDLKPGDKEYEKLKRSLKEFGYVEPVIWNETTGRLVGGHQRLKVLKDLGYSEIDCVIVKLTEEKEKALNIAMNKISGEWDNNLLANLLKELDQEGFDVTLTGFDLNEAKELFGSGSMENVHEDNFDAEKEVSEIDSPITKQGDLWCLGRHRLVCGDSTKLEYYNQVLDGKVADLLVTDPPYNIDYGGTISGNGRDIANDNLSDTEFYEFLLAFYKASGESLKKGAPLYIFHSTKETVNFTKALVDAGLKYAQTLVWYKNHFTLGRQDYQWIHEPILYGWKEGQGHYFIDDRTQDTIWEYNKPKKNEEHPTMKPLELCGRAISNSSKVGEIVLDLFGGSGSTLIASDQLKRKALLMELDERFVDVIVKRYLKATGNYEGSYLIRGGKSYPLSDIEDYIVD